MILFENETATDEQHYDEDAQIAAELKADRDAIDMDEDWIDTVCSQD